MRHFRLTRWIDYVRGVETADRMRAMRRHLEDGCARCAARVAALERVAETAAGEAEQAPPAHAVASVKALFAIDRRQKSSLFERLLLTPSFDSALQPAAAGMRSAAAGRELVYEGGDFAVELRVEELAPDGRTAVIAGQLLGVGGEPVADASAFLYSDGQLAAGCLTGEWGDFELHGRPGAPFELYLLAAEEGRCLVVELPGSSQDDPA